MKRLLIFISIVFIFGLSTFAQEKELVKINQMVSAGKTEEAYSFAEDIYTDGRSEAKVRIQLKRIMLYLKPNFVSDRLMGFCGWNRKQLFEQGEYDFTLLAMYKSHQYLTLDSILSASSNSKIDIKLSFSILDLYDSQLDSNRYSAIVKFYSERLPSAYSSITFLRMSKYDESAFEILTKFLATNKDEISPGLKTSLNNWAFNHTQWVKLLGVLASYKIYDEGFVLQKKTLLFNRLLNSIKNIDTVSIGAYYEYKYINSFLANKAFIDSLSFMAQNILTMKDTARINLLNKYKYIDLIRERADFQSGISKLTLDYFSAQDFSSLDYFIKNGFFNPPIDSLLAIYTRNNFSSKEAFQFLKSYSLTTKNISPSSRYNLAKLYIKDDETAANEQLQELLKVPDEILKTKHVNYFYREIAFSVLQKFVQARSNLTVFLGAAQDDDIKFAENELKWWNNSNINSKSKLFIVTQLKNDFNISLEPITPPVVQQQVPLATQQATVRDSTSAIVDSLLVKTEDAAILAFTVTEPIIIEGRDYINTDGTVLIRGKFSSQFGIKSVLVNNSTATILPTSEFFISYRLAEGANYIILKVIDNKHSYSEKTLKIVCDIDKIGPEITLAEPVRSQGVLLTTKKDLLKVSGFSVDKNGVSELLVNGRPTNINVDGSFTVDIALAKGINKITLRAADTKQNVTIDTFSIWKDQEDLAGGGKYYAFIVGIDSYSGTWAPLKNAVHDAKGVEDVLKKYYTFSNVYTLYNTEASRTKIMDKFEDLVNTLTPEDNLLIFYSGHGEFKKNMNKGFWVPADAITQSASALISNSDLQNYLNSLPTKHTLLISDACFSADIFRGATSQIPFEDNDKYYHDVYKLPSKAALTSGGIEPVADGGKEGHSIFTYYLLKALQENKSDYLTGNQVFNSLIIPVSNNSDQKPVYMGIKGAGDEGGQFVFIRKK